MFIVDRQTEWNWLKAANDFIEARKHISTYPPFNFFERFKCYQVILLLQYNVFKISLQILIQNKMADEGFKDTNPVKVKPKYDARSRARMPD